ncbi:LacI family DNA-binding transcriptional regulator [Ruminococcus gauvreauii]|uniref:LacI family transcriptional regulator n=1 Tax=Ruminococcus gauvreauii TaxID=438033 RepID=A0ABY5VJY8_9FIRM|nr:LacI family DNA-binding transcriptional regulator [Ruminococcus gauvreauii]UWP60536.1 LacI family transcriptional regulator [Ruminococcus gauvreauii]
MTSRELAALAGVSQSTVSRVLNNCDHVSDRKRQKVMELARIYNFELDGNARSLKTQKLNRVGVFLSDYFVGFDRNLFWSNIYSKLHTELREKGLTALPVYACDAPMQETLNRLIRQRQMDHIILVATDKFYGEDNLQILFEKEIPFVCIYDRAKDNRYYRRQDVNIIALDFKSAGRIAASFLYQRGHRRLALHINSNDQSNNSRCCGFRGALPGDCTIQEIKTRSGISPITFEGGYAAAADHLDIFRECTAVLAANDAAAIGMISALQECGLKVPGDISVIGINDIPMCRWWRPHLTTVAFDVQEIITHTIDLLTRGREARQMIISPKLVVRESVK